VCVCVCVYVYIYMYAYQVSVEQRRRAKKVVYGLIYGSGTAQLAREIGVSPQEARKFVRAFNVTFPRVPHFLAKVAVQCRKQGYVSTLLGRKRHLPSICSADAAKQAAAERRAVNTVCQGSAADVVKVAMIRVREAFRNLQAECLAGERDVARLVMQVHDELVFEVRKDKVEPVCRAVRQSMEAAVALRVALPVRMAMGESWGRLQPLDSFLQSNGLT